MSGAGYGLLILLTAFGAMDVIPMKRWLGFFGFGLAFALITTGLLASTFHLGRPERAWRAFSQWRTSWLSREGVAAVATYLPSGLLAIYWMAYETSDLIVAILAIMTIVCALATIYCTGMIYASLKTIRHWHHPLVPWVFVALALATGALLLTLLLHVFAVSGLAAVWVGIPALIAALVLKLAYWSAVDQSPKTYTAESATGLGALGTVRPLEPAHSQPNFVMREMGYEVGRRHGARLRQIALVFGLILPALLLAVVLFASGFLALLASLIAVLSGGLGVVAERWLFFAQAQHVVTLYYRGGVA